MSATFDTPIASFATATTTATAALLLATDARCTYPSKPCSNSRAVKQDKTLHRLCEMHRRRANLNQQRMQQRRRLLRRRLSQDTRDTNSYDGSSLGSAGNSVDSDALVLAEMNALATSPLTFHDHEFSPEELHVLEYMLFDSDEYFDDIDVNTGNDLERSFGGTDWRFSC